MGYVILLWHSLSLPYNYFFIASSFRVTEENLVFETVQSGPYSSFEFFSALKGTHFFILFEHRREKTISTIGTAQIHTL